MRTRRSAFRRGALPTSRRDEQGYVTIILAIILPVLFVSAAFTVDFGSWYARAAQLKRGADAAALAGVVWMPDFTQAKTHALTAAARNGFQDGVNNITVSVDQVPGKNRQLSVTITDNKAAQFFSSLVFKGQKIARSSTAEYVLPVPMGSPKNTFGTGDLVPGADRENFWAAVSGYCSGHESGDDKLAKYETYSTGATQCQPSGGTANAAYDPNGYLYAIDLPPGAPSLKLDAFDAPYFADSRPDGSLVGSPTVTTIFEVYDRNPTPLDLSHLTLLRTITFLPGSPVTYKNAWTNLYTWTSPQEGQYYVRVRTAGGQSNSRASNGFGLHTYTGSTASNYTGTTPSTCTTIVGAPGYSASCPQIHAVTDMSIYATLPGATADFYLAQIDPVHAGKTMRLTLFDPGEGANSLQILDPNGSPASFSWSTQCNPPTPPTGGCSGSGTSLDVSGTGAQPFSGLQSSSRYNDRYVTLDVKLPNNYSTLYGTKTWWKVRYAVGTTPTDRTTWSVNIVGDPVHLLK